VTVPPSRAGPVQECAIRTDGSSTQSAT
jgi:hypothetical protein